MLHADEEHQILLTDLMVAPEALTAILRDHLAKHHGFKGTGLSFGVLVVSHEVKHNLAEYERREGIRL